MTNTLRELYEEKVVCSYTFSEEHRRLRKQETELWDKVTPLLGREAVDKLLQNQGDIQELTNFEWFREGFLLGASLMLELL